MLKKPYLKVQNLQYKFFDWKLPPFMVPTWCNDHTPTFQHLHSATNIALAEWHCLFVWHFPAVLQKCFYKQWALVWLSGHRLSNKEESLLAAGSRCCQTKNFLQEKKNKNTVLLRTLLNLVHFQRGNWTLNVVAFTIDWKPQRRSLTSGISESLEAFSSRGYESEWNYLKGKG